MSGIGWTLTPGGDLDGGEESGWAEAAMSGKLSGGGSRGAAKLANWALGKVLGKEKGPPDEDSLFSCK